MPCSAVKNMLGTNICSDSQESALMDDETYQDIEKTFGGTLPIQDVNEFVISEEKPNIPYVPTKSVSVLEEKKIKQMIEEDEEYYTVYNDIPDYFPSPLNFQFTFADGGGQDWVYSSTLEKMYIKMEKVLPLRFSWEPATSGLFLRTELVFKLDEYKSDPVRRCYNHVAMTNYVNQTMDPCRIKHVVHCVNHASSMYQEKDEHLSILTPLCAPEAGSQYVPMCFKFFCKNSCASAMNRRATELVFTLEDERNQILARRTMAIRICSCPKRDKQKDEDAELQQESVPVKRKLVSSCDQHVYKVELSIVGKENYLAVYKYAYDIMAGQAIKTGQHEFFKPYMENILNQIP